MTVRLSTSMLYMQGRDGILRQQSRMAELGEQLSTGRRVNRPSDDPQAAARAVTVAESAARQRQFADTRETARGELAAQERELSRVTDALPSVKALLVQAGNGTLGDADRGALADELEGLYEEILGAANARDGQGRYLFAGFDNETPAFEGERGQLTYGGDEGQRELRVDTSRRMGINRSGAEIFAGMPSAARPVARADAANSGSATFADLAVRDRALADASDGFDLQFTKDNDGALRYRVTDRATGTEIDSQPFEPGQTIAIGEAYSLRIAGEPADGDGFAVGGGGDANMLNTLAGVVDALRAPVVDAAAQARLDNTLTTAHRELDNGLDHVGSVRASIGADLSALDNLDRSGAERSIDYERQLSALVDVDPVAAISDYNLSRVGLQFAQKTFLDIEQLSLFNLT